MKSIVTVIEQVYHQAPPAQPTPVVSRYSAHSDSAEQVYSRTLTIKTGQWEPIHFGWLEGEDISLLLLQNHEGEGLTRIPTAEESRGIDAKLVELSFSGEGVFADIQVPPGQSCRFQPGSSSMWIRCLSGPARVTLTLFP